MTLSFEFLVTIKMVAIAELSLTQNPIVNNYKQLLLGNCLTDVQNKS